MTTRGPIPDTPIVGLLHPGAMGAAVAAVLVERGHAVVACLDDRSVATQQRAERTGVRRLASLDELVTASGARYVDGGIIGRLDERKHGPPLRRPRAVSVTAKAWRFEGEMHEIVDVARVVEKITERSPLD